MKPLFRIISEKHYQTMKADNERNKKYIVRYLRAEEKIRELEAQNDTLRH